MMVVRLGLCLLFSISANMTDWKSFKIRNEACVSFFLLGLAVQWMTEGASGLLNGLGGSAVMLSLFPLFVLRMLGAGDVKALMAIGAMAGWSLARWVLVYSILGSGAIGLVVLMVRRNGRERMKRFWNYLKLCFYTRSIQPYSQTMEKDDGTFRFSFGITLGVAVLLVQNIG